MVCFPVFIVRPTANTVTAQHCALQSVPHILEGRAQNGLERRNWVESDQAFFGIVEQLQKLNPRRQHTGLAP